VVVGSINADRNTYGIYHKYWDGKNWSPGPTEWEALGGTATRVPPVIVSWGPNRLDIFAIGPNDNLLHKAWDGAQWLPSRTEWENLGGICRSAPAVCCWGPNRLDIVVIGSDGGLFHKAWDGTQWLPSRTGWEPLGGSCDTSFAPRIVSHTPYTFDLFVVGYNNHHLYTKRWAGIWNPSQYDWTDLGGNLTSAPAAVPADPANLYVYATGTEGAIWRKTLIGRSSPNWRDWEPLGGNAWGDPAAVMFPSVDDPPGIPGGSPRLVHIFVPGAGAGANHLYHQAIRAEDNTPQSGWLSVGGAVSPGVHDGPSNPSGGGGGTPTTGRLQLNLTPTVLKSQVLALKSATWTVTPQWDRTRQVSKSGASVSVDVPKPPGGQGKVVITLDSVWHSDGYIEGYATNGDYSGSLQPNPTTVVFDGGNHSVGWIASYSLEPDDNQNPTLVITVNYTGYQ
jgi:hypothetical protein